MAQPTFFKQPLSSTLAEIAALTKAHLVDPSRADLEIKGLASLDEAGPSHLIFFDNLKYAGQLAQTRAGACLVSERFAATVPSHVALLRAADPFRAFVTVARELHAATLRPPSWFGTSGIAASAVIHPTAQRKMTWWWTVCRYRTRRRNRRRFGDRLRVVIGPNVKIGGDCDVGAGTTIQFALGNNVLIHPGCHRTGRLWIVSAPAVR